MNTVEKAQRFRIKLRDSIIPKDLTKAKIKANQFAKASGLHRNTFVRAFCGEQIGEPFIAAFLALNPTLTFEQAFEIVAPANYRTLVVGAGGTVAKAKLPDQDIIESYEQGVADGVEVEFLDPDTRCVTATVVVTKDTEWVFANPKTRPLTKGDVVPVIRWYESGQVTVFPALRVPGIKERFANALLAHGFDPDRVRWVEGSEPNQETGRMLGPRHLLGGRDTSGYSAITM